MAEPQAGWRNQKEDWTGWGQNAPRNNLKPEDSASQVASSAEGAARNDGLGMDFDPVKAKRDGAGAFQLIKAAKNAMRHAVLFPYGEARLNRTVQH